METKYDPNSLEPRWEKAWLEADLFHGDETSANAKFSVVIPPPNVTGSLHLGHALNNTLQDILCRYKRMTGHEVLWMPGTDHAGIATQNVVERQLTKEGTTRQALGREKFLERVWAWKATSGGTIVGQLKRLGCSCDWSRERFTMDDGLSAAVRETFVRLYKEGLIYRGAYIINWCPRCESALADLEVDYPDEPEAGQIYRLEYPFAEPIPGGPAGISIDTTRPETMLGDTAVAVHPEDPRYQFAIGRELLLPISGRRIPVVADAFVDREFGTGAVKITPSHDPNDFEAGRRHSLPHLTVIGFDGKMTKDAGKYAGLDRFACRTAIVEELRALGALKSVNPHQLKTGRCYRCQTVIEPLVSTQWFVKMKGLADAAADAVRDGRTKIVPQSWESTYFHWLENIRDWCISRQLWWGHRIPVWYCGECNRETCAAVDPATCAHCSSKNIRQDEDVLDTWFSSALWPFSTMGWPEQTKTLQAFYPTSVLITGFDILFFWVARMMMMGLKLTDSVPFYDIYLHAMVRDEHGQKMSKSKGNVIDPLDLINEYGADALRFTLAIMTLQGRDVNLSTSRIGGYRNFLNKVWNAVRFLQLTVDANAVTKPFKASVRSAEDVPNDLASRWIRSRLAATLQGNESAYGEYQFSEVCSANYRFFWDEFCAWYLEIVKVQLRDASDETKRQTLNNLVLLAEVSLRLLHPVVPFITEELWHSLPELNGEKRTFLLEAAFPRAELWGGAIVSDAAAEREFELVQGVVSAVRTTRSEHNIPPAQPLEVFITGDSHQLGAIGPHEALIKGLAKISALVHGEGGANVKTHVVGGLRVGVSLAGVEESPAEKAKREKERARLGSEISRLEEKLQSASFLQNAPGDVVERERKKLAEYRAKLEAL